MSESWEAVAVECRQDVAAGREHHSASTVSKASNQHTGSVQHRRPKVLLVDDHCVWRHGLRNVLESNFDIVAEAGEGNEAVDKALAYRPDVVVLDINMPGMDGIAATRRIKEALPDIGVVIITAAADDQCIHRAILAGANGYVVKDDSSETMCQAIHYAAQGGAFLPPPVASRVLQGMNSLSNGMGAVAKNDNSLTGRETAVLRLLAEGYRHKEIARELHISVRTVGNHIFSIYNKLGIDDRAQAIRYAIKEGIVRV